MAFTTYTGSMSSDSAAHAKGPYTEVVASTPYDSSRLYLQLAAGSNNGRLVLVDLATGGAGAETVAVANIATTIDVDIMTAIFVPVTVDLPAGTRLALRCQTGLSAATTESFVVHLEDRALGSIASPVTYGAVTAASRGTVLDPGTTINTKGSYVQVSASTSARIDTLVLCTTASQAGSTFITAFTSWLLDIATGTSGAESVLLPNFRYSANTNVDCLRPPSDRSAGLRFRRAHDSRPAVNVIATRRTSACSASR